MLVIARSAADAARGPEPREGRHPGQLLQPARARRRHRPDDPGRRGAARRAGRSSWPAMRDRIKDNRRALVAALEARAIPGDWGGIATQRGMFALLGLTAHQVARLKDEHGVYVVGKGRINVAGLHAGQPRPVRGRPRRGDRRGQLIAAPGGDPTRATRRIRPVTRAQARPAPRASSAGSRPAPSRASRTTGPAAPASRPPAPSSAGSGGRPTDQQPRRSGRGSAAGSGRPPRCRPCRCSPRSSVDPVAPGLRHQQVRDRDDRRRRPERDRELPPLAAEGEPQEADTRRDLGEQHERPGPRVAEARPRSRA